MSYILLIMNIVNILPFKKIFRENQTYLDDFVRLDIDFEPFFKRNKKYCGDSIDLIDEFQTVLLENIDDINNIDEFKSFNDFNDSDSNDDQILLVDFDENNLDWGVGDFMVDRLTFNESLRNNIKRGFGIDIFEDVEESNVISYPDNRFAMLKRICPHCGESNANVKGWERRIYKTKENKSVEYYPQSYVCNECDKWFITPVDFKVDKELKEKKKLDDKIRKIHANTGLSFDKIAEVVEISMNINVSHEYVRNVIQKEHDEFVYETDIVPLPGDFKKKGKTSLKREVTDLGILFMCKNKKHANFGHITVDELFTNINGQKNYLVTIFSNEIKDMPISIAITNTRHYDVINKFFDFTFDKTPIQSLTSDMLGVYGKIAENKNIPQQQCIFHWMKYTTDKIFDEIKKENIPEKDITYNLMIFTEMKEILRSFDENKTKELLAKYEKNIFFIADPIQKIMDKFSKQKDKLTAYSKDNKIRRTTSQAETFNSLPQIRHKKHTSKKPWSLLLSLSSTIKFYKPNHRTLQNRQ
ncbi:hypothetical protein [Methanobrevibacter sp. DSM 116169]|uniref:hypothetical protein n=1 Tax=Methanobrevibacter sp. DSM 116169 TaxID=3242727 RepID=UPI0038FC0C23